MDRPRRVAASLLATPGRLLALLTIRLGNAARRQSDSNSRSGPPVNLRSTDRPPTVGASEPATHDRPQAHPLDRLGRATRRPHSCDSRSGPAADLCLMDKPLPNSAMPETPGKQL